MPTSRVAKPLCRRPSDATPDSTAGAWRVRASQVMEVDVRGSPVLCGCACHPLAREVRLRGCIGSPVRQGVQTKAASDCRTPSLGAAPGLDGSRCARKSSVLTDRRQAPRLRPRPALWLAYISHRAVRLLGALDHGELAQRRGRHGASAAPRSRRAAGRTGRPSSRFRDEHRRVPRNDFNQLRRLGHVVGSHGAALDLRGIDGVAPGCGTATASAQPDACACFKEHGGTVRGEGPPLPSLRPPARALA